MSSRLIEKRTFFSRIHPAFSRSFLLMGCFLLLVLVQGDARSSFFVPEFPPCDPTPRLLNEIPPGQPQPLFCSQWDPYFKLRNYHCCAKIRFPTRTAKNRKGKSIQLPGKGMARDYCEDKTSEQNKYIESVNSGKLEDILGDIQNKMGTHGDQAYCSEHDGFLAYGRPVLATSKNRILVKAPRKCLHFGTDFMVGMLEWLGKEVGERYKSDEYKGVRLTVGNISAPRGGPLYSARGKRKHLSHTSGQDADVGFLVVQKGMTPSDQFPRHMDAAANWWLIQRVFKNPYACVKAVFLDRHLIHKLGQTAKKDKNWPILRRFIRHMPGHKNHFHIRIGKGPGGPGCTPDFNVEVESEADED